MSEKPEPAKTEISTIFGRCRCCLEYGYMKKMWDEHYEMGECEIYGEMLLETFSIAWDISTDSKTYICELCVVRLRDAFNFKKEVLASDKLLQDDSDNEFQTEEEKSDIWYDYKEDTEQKSVDNQELEYEEERLEEEGLEDESDSQQDTEEYEEVEYLDEYATEVAGNSASSSKKTGGGKWPRKKRSHKVTRPYKNYSVDDMRSALEAVTGGEMSILEASKKYGVPRKTIAAKVLSLKNNTSDTTEAKLKLMTQDNQYNFVEEVKKILTLTTAVPFKVKASRYFCAYCYTNLDYFDHPAALRSHTRHHDHEMLQFLDKILRPQYQNEILRVDIEEFSCKACSQELPSWNDMFQHMNEIHGIEFDQVYTRLIPYKLTGEKVNCALCLAEFPNFQYLDAHMNAHYANYMCSECGDTFVTEVRLKHHQLIHNTGKHSCRYCGKTFSLEKYKKKHEGMVHNEYKLFKCLDCGEKFHREYERHMHVVKDHPERVRISTCEFCGKVFDWRPYYLAHLRKTHSKVKKNVCRYCQKRFVTKHELKMHELRHTGEGRHVCLFCDKNFVTVTELKKHSVRHIKEIQEVQVTQVVV